MTKENKYEITQKMFEFFETTRAGWDMTGMEYRIGGDFSEEIVIHYRNHSDEVVNVTADSGIAMMADVMKALY